MYTGNSFNGCQCYIELYLNEKCYSKIEFGKKILGYPK